MHADFRVTDIHAQRSLQVLHHDRITEGCIGCHGTCTASVELRDYIDFLQVVIKHDFTLHCQGPVDVFTALDRQMEAARKVVAEVDEDFARVFGRRYGGLIDTYRMEDAETALITMGTATSTARVAVDELRSEGRKVGLIKLRFMRPFPHQEIAEAVKGLKALGVFDRSISVNRFGPVFSEVRNSLYGSGIPITDHIAGIGGRDLKVATFKEMFKVLEDSASGKRVRDCTWHGLRGEM